jgi:hypothetical protein
MPRKGTAGVAFVADDLGAWLVGLLADRGRKKLTTLILGPEQERALRSAATAAVELLGRELRPGDAEQAEYVALVISQVFSEPLPAASLARHQTMLEALQAGIAGQLAVLDDANLTGQDQSSADLLGVPGRVLAEKLTTDLVREIVVRGSRGGPLEPLAAQLNHDVTHLQGQQIHHAVRQLSGEILEALARLDAAHTGQPRSQTPPDIALHVEQLFEDLALDEHEKAERRVNRLFLHLSRDQQRASLAAISHVATTTKDQTTQLLACNLLEAADRLDPMLIKVEEVETFAQSAHFCLRSAAAALLWQWAESNPGRVPVPLLGKLALPSTEDWYVHTAARAGAKQLLLRRAAARAIFDRMAGSRDPNDRDYAVADLLEVAEIEPRAVPPDLARRLARDEDKSVASRATKLLRALDGIGENERWNYYGPFSM